MIGLIFVVGMFFLLYYFFTEIMKLLEKYLQQKAKYQEDLIKLTMTADEQFKEMLNKNWTPWARAKGIVK